MGEDVMATIGMPSETTTDGSGAQPFAQAPVVAPGESPELVVTPAQRAFLDAVDDAGLTPSSDLSALNIGSCVCQAKAAKQNDQEVWDFILPMVRGDARDSFAEPVTPPAGQVNAETSDYIRIATETLC
ncbi:DUF732 domain-containing protein [Mycobacterium yunnanensis]|nr:DUF732 domain-containing protein [Mycobacterium yunnanensis]